jgi:hypothetical protein
MSERKPSALQTEFEFTLPKGYVDAEGGLHRQGRMRLATAMDEIVPLRDPRVKSNQAYLTVVILARVITRLGSLDEVNTNVVENLFTADLAYLQDFYRTINSNGSTQITVNCPNCSHAFQVEASEPGES